MDIDHKNRKITFASEEEKAAYVKRTGPLPLDYTTEVAYIIEPDQRRDIARQIGVNILLISGGRVKPIADGIELPVGSGYTVRVQLTGADDYTVSRVFKRAGKEWVKGQRERVYADEVSEVAYYASCYRSYDETEWPAK